MICFGTGAYSAYESNDRHAAPLGAPRKVGAIRKMKPDDLVRNGLHVGDDKIIYARDLGARNEALASQFPRRSMYRYSQGRLEPVR